MHTVFVGFKRNLIGTMMNGWKSSDELSRETPRRSPMHDLLIALAFIGMVVAPAVVAAKSGNSEPNVD
jgi:hypothetical protein